MFCKRFTLNFLIFVTLLIPAACEKSGIDKPIRLGYLQNDLHHLPLFVALEKGFIKQAGLDYKVSGVFRAGPEEMSAFAAGELDIGYVGQAPATAAYLNSVADIRFISQSNQEGSSIVVRENSEIKSVTDFKARTIAIPGHATMQDFLLRKALKTAGISYEEVKIIVLKPPEMSQALINKNIDAFIAWEPYSSQAETGGIGRTLISSSSIWENHPCCVVVADAVFSEKYPLKIKKFKEVHARACLFIQNNIEESISIGQKYTGMDKETVKKAVSMIKYDPGLDMGKAVQFVDFLMDLRYIKPQNKGKSIKSVFNE